MVGPVARGRIALVAAPIGWVFGRQVPEPERGQQHCFHVVDDRSGRFALEKRERQAADRQDLVRPDGSIDGTGDVVDVDDVAEPAGAKQETRGEACPRPFRRRNR